MGPTGEYPLDFEAAKYLVLLYSLSGLSMTPNSECLQA